MIENNNQINLNEGQKQSFSNKTKTFLKNTTKAVRDTIAATGIAVSTLIPASVESLTTIAPTAAKVVAVPTAAALVTACHDDLDTTPPRIDVVQNQIEIQGGESLRISGNQIYVGNTLMFRCSDDVSTNLNISVTFNGKPISSGYTFNEGGTISVRATDDAGNVSKTASSQITKKEVAEEIKCSTHLSAVDITKGDQITRDGNAVFAGSKKIFARDNNDYTLSINYNNDSNAKLPITVEDNSDIAFTLSYKGKSQSRTTKITVNDVEDQNKAPEITRKYPENKIPNILGGVVVKGDNNKLLFGDVVIYEGKDDNTDVCTPSLKLKGSDEERIGKETNSAGTYVFTLTDEKGKSTSVEFQIKSESIDLTNLNNLNMQVGQEVDLLAGIDIPSGIEISKVEVEINGQHSEVKDYHHYTPSQPGTCYIYITEKGEFGNTYIEKSKNPLTIKDIEHQEYQSITIDNIKPEEILPIIGQVNRGDRNVYKYIEHLRVAEATRIRDMMRKYGTGAHSPEKYQELMGRLNTGMTMEKPLGFDNYGVIGGITSLKADDHAYTERSILDGLIKHANFYVVNSDSEIGDRYTDLNNFIKNNPQNINIFGNSAYISADNKDDFQKYLLENDITDLCNSKNLIIFAAGTNIRTQDGNIKNKIYNGKYEADEHGRYSLASMANSDKNNYPNIHLLVTIATNQNGDINQTNEKGDSSKYPMYFANNSLFSGRAFPFQSWNNSSHIVGRSAKYPTSDTNYLNVALTDLCFQMHADVKDVDELIDMIRSTALTDYIRFDLNGDGDTNDKVDGQTETQPLQLINPAGVFKEYCMISDIPSTIQAGETIALTKGYYKGIIFDIPGAEVKVNGEWIPYNKANESLIKSQNPMNLERRLNTNEAIKYGNKNLKGKIITVDDQWNGLNIDKEISLNIN